MVALNQLQTQTGALGAPVGAVNPAIAQQATRQQMLGGVRPDIQNTMISPPISSPSAMVGQSAQGVDPAVANQQFGLSGAEAAQQAGLQSALGSLQGGTMGALDILQGGQDFAQSRLNQGASALGGDFSARASSVDPTTGLPLFREAAAGVGAFSPAGLQAQGLQSALSGAQGQEAFNQALLDSPIQRFLQEQGQQAVVNQAAATGGLGGGAVQQELQRVGQGIAGQQLQQQIANLQNLSGQGLQAAGQQGQFLSQAGQTQANLAAQNAQMATQASLASAQNRLGAAQGMANLFGQRAGIGSSLASQGAGIMQGGGLNAANLLSGTAQDVAGQRLQAGRDIAGQVSGVSSGLSNLQNQLGQGQSGLIGQGAGNIGNILQQAGQGTAQQQQNLAQLLANISVGAGSGALQSGQSIGQTQQAGAQQASQQQAQTAGTIMGLMAMFSDERLKNNIELAGSKNGINFYNWAWNDKMPIKELRGKKDFGVLAQEIEETYPELVIEHESGYKQVNYSGIGELTWQTV